MPTARKMDNGKWQTSGGTTTQHGRRLRSDEKRRMRVWARLTVPESRRWMTIDTLPGRRDDRRRKRGAAAAHSAVPSSVDGGAGGWDSGPGDVHVDSVWSDQADWIRWHGRQSSCNRQSLTPCSRSSTSISCAVRRLHQRRPSGINGLPCRCSPPSLTWKHRASNTFFNSCTPGADAEAHFPGGGD